MERDLVVVGFPLGRWQTNCFVVGDRAAGRAVVIDPGEHGADRVPEALDGLGLRCDAILLTHGHLDHFWAVPDLARSLDVEVHLHPGDRWLWDDPAAGFGNLPSGALEQAFGLRWDPPHDRLVDLADGQRLDLAGLSFDVQHNPGHTPGHVTFLGRGLSEAEYVFDMGTSIPGDDVLFSGDLVFAGSIGRTDFPRGSYAEILRSLATTVLPMQDDTLILSGHGPETTVGRERATNPFLAEARDVQAAG